MHGSFFFLSNLDDSNNMQPEIFGPRWVVTKVFPLSLRLFPVIKKNDVMAGLLTCRSKPKDCLPRSFPVALVSFGYLHTVAGTVLDLNQLPS